MKKHGIGSRLLALLLVLAMVLPMMPLSAKAEDIGTLTNVDTGLTGEIDTEDTISLPIRIMDYENDGMLFEYAESKLTKKPADFGATYACDYTDDGVSAYSSTVVYAYTADYKSRLQNTGADNQYMKVEYASGNGADYISYFNQSSYDAKTGTTYKLSQIRYLAFVYRARSISSTSMSFGLDTTSGYSDHASSYTSASFPVSMGTDWTYQIVDLYSTGASASTTVYGILMNAPMISSGNYIDVAYAAYFANEDQAKAFAEYALTKGSDNGDNRAFGLLRGSRSETDDGTDDNGYGSNFAGIHKYVNTGAKYGAAKDTIYQVPWSSTDTLDLSTVTNLGYNLLGIYGTKSIANIGLLESTLSDEGYPVYKEEVVTYLAYLLQHSLEIPERTDDGWKNYRYVKGTPSPIYGNVDLATALRTRIQERIGSYDEAAAKGLVGTWTECEGKIASYYDAAYFLLNSIFVPDSYNEPQDNENAEHYYDYLVLSAGYDSKTVTDENPTGDKIYVFDGGFSTSSDPETAQMAIDYNDTSHTIQNTTAAGKAHFYYVTSDTTTLNPFLPVLDDNTAEGMTKNPFYQDDGIINGVKKQVGKDSTYQRDYNFAMVSSGEFVYHADDELFFEFEGDDDVYLFINNELVMDIGSAHSIDSVRFELNDYVEAAKAGELGSDERNARLSLVEGNTYNFDFFYMERHSYGSNMRINTNIRISDPSMSTDKTAYVDGVQVEYGGIVNASSIVEYGFQITNEGGENLYNIGFTDNDIGVKLDPENGLTITGDRVYSLDGTKLEPGNTAHRDKLVTELTAVLGGENREEGFVYDPITVTFASNQELIYFLQNITSSSAIQSGGGLWKGSYVSFRGIGYMLSAEQAQSGWFDNTVFSTATNLTGSKTLKSQDTMRVCVPSDPMYYQWAGHDLQISLDKLIDDINAAANQEGNALSGKVSNLTAASVTNIVEITKGNNAADYAEVVIDKTLKSDGYYTINNIWVNYQNVGSHVFYVKIYYMAGSKNVIVPIVVNVTDVKPSVFVLDYGLKADLTENGGEELFKNDTLSVPGRATASTILAMGTGGVYSPNEITFTEETDGVMDAVGNVTAAVDGTFTFTKDAQKLIFTPSDFMEAEYKTQIAVNVYESDINPSNITGTLDINNEVEMYKDITVLPATVVYYEDCFPAIHYIAGDDQEQANKFEALGSQSVDQDENYGHDDYYADDTDDSANSLTTITIKELGPVAYFTFKGTGFELISRTNAYDSATIYMAVFNDKVDAEKITFNENDGCYYDDAGNKLEPVKNIPVITEFDNGANGGEEEIYQVPVIRVDDLALATYNVVICGIPAYDWSQSTYPDDMVVIPTNLYVDGLRIFRPIGASNDNYTADEDGAAFTEIRDLIQDGHAAVATYTGTAVNVSTGTTTWTENRNNTFEGNEVNSVDDYLLYGPNNEVYMDGAFSDSALYFQVTESGTGTHALQVAIHAVDQGLFYGAGTTGMHAPVYYATAAGTWQLLDTITSGTEMYYTIDYTKCPVANDAYQIILKVDIGEDYDTAMASYTTIKTVGLDIGNVGGKGTTLAYEHGILTDTATGEAVDPANYPAFQLLGKMLSTSVMAAPEQPKPANPFVDAEEGSFYYDAMLWAVENGITNGTSATTFSPGKQVSRAETVTFLWRAAGQPEPTIVKNPFVDVSANDFYYKAVLWAVENGITNGMDATHFGPYAICNRAQVVTFLWRAAGEPAHETAENPFRDAEVGSFYYDAMLWAVENGITNGIDANNFGPAANCNRAQIVTFLYRAQ